MFFECGFLFKIHQLKLYIIVPKSRLLVGSFSPLVSLFGAVLVRGGWILSVKSTLFLCEDGLANSLYLRYMQLYNEMTGPIPTGLKPASLPPALTTSMPDSPQSSNN
jgi:hypothetical protein